MDEKKYVIAVFIDLKKAFDVVDHSVLLNKLWAMGIRGEMHSLIASFLKDRPQFVTVNGIESNEILNNCGVPQGSVLGPLLYLIHVLSLKQAGLIGRYFTFADDTVFFYSGSNLQSLEQTVNDDLCRYSKWLLHNKLKLNAEKTVYLVFQQKNTEHYDFNININNMQLSQVHTTKYLGLILDDKLNWNSHIDSLVKKIIPMLGALHRCTKFLNTSNRYAIYNAYILSNLRYLINIWGTCGVTSFKRVQVLQNRAIKILFQMPYRTSSELLYSNLSLQPIRYVFELEQCKQIYNILRCNLKCNSKLKTNSELYEYNTRGNQNLHVGNIRTHKALYNPLMRATLMFNNVPVNVRQAPSFKLFLIKLKEFLNTKVYF